MKGSLVLCLLAICSVQGMTGSDQQLANNHVKLNGQEVQDLMRRTADLTNPEETQTDEGSRRKRELNSPEQEEIQEDEEEEKSRSKRDVASPGMGGLDLDVNVKLDLSPMLLENADIDVNIEVGAAGGESDDPLAEDSTAPAEDGSTSPPAEGSTAPPEEGSTSPPAEGSTSPPEEGSTSPPEEGSTSPPAEGTTVPSSQSTTTIGEPKSRLFCSDDCGISVVKDNRIVGGQDATKHEFPFIVRIEIDSSDFITTGLCGGSIIKKSWILTAAHCFIDPDTGFYYNDLAVKITAAEHDTSTTNETSEIVITPTGNVLFIHPDYKTGENWQESEEHDLALIYLGGDFTWGDSVRPVCMPFEEDYVPESEVIASGWGTTSYQGSSSDILQEVALTLKSQEDCETINNDAPNTYFITDNMICALTPGKDSCQGDSGGPLVYHSADGRWSLVGSTSFGYQCADPDHAGFYVNIYNYLDWMVNVTGPAEC